jgi:DNA-binding NarL/FixJ family response regulator
MRVTIADDAVLFREGLARLLTDAGIDVAGTVGDARALVDCVRDDPPDVAIVDIRMPPTHTTEGLEAARTLRDLMPDLGILVLSQHIEAHYALQLLDPNAHSAGYLLKERVTDIAELTDAVHRIAAGGLVIDPSVVAQLVGRHRRRNPIDALSDREREVLALMAEGRSNQAISDRLYLSPKTVEAYVRSVFTKLDLHQAADDNRRVLAVLAFLGV